MTEISPTARSALDDLPQAQRERLSYIDFRLYFFGELRRSDVGQRFGIGPAGATRDIAMYRKMAPDNLELDFSSKLYRLTPGFIPLFEHAPQRVLTALSQGFGEGISGSLESMVRCDIPLALSLPRVDVLAPITRAIHQKKAVRLGYTSLKSGTTQKELVPLALVDIGTRWHVRAFDRARKEFRDYVLTRMCDLQVIENSTVLKEESSEFDFQWSRVIELELVAHPQYPRHELVVMDYPMTEGVLKVKVRAANAGYMLQRWSVDCSADHHMKGPSFALWLRDPLSLYGSNAELAPGYGKLGTDPEESRRTLSDGRVGP